eukprot:4640686-Pleurochrysis_carterae.AAC.1
MNKAFQAWKKRVVHDLDKLAEGKDEGEERIEKEKTDWMSDLLREPTNPRNGCLSFTEAYILDRGAITIPYHTLQVKRCMFLLAS